MLDKDKLVKIQEFAKQSLEQIGPEASFVPDPIVDKKWRAINSRKWEFRSNNLVLATIFHKPNGKYSLWIKSPDFYNKVHQVVAETFLYDSFELATEGFNVLLKERGMDWCVSVVEYLRTFDYDICLRLD